MNDRLATQLPDIIREFPRVSPEVVKKAAAPGRLFSAFRGKAVRGRRIFAAGRAKGRRSPAAALSRR